MRTKVTLIVCLSLACALTRTAPTTMDSGRDFDVVSGSVRLPVHTMGGGANARTMVALHGGPGIVADYLETLRPLASDTLRVVFYDQRGSPRVESQLLRDGRADPTAYAPEKLAADLLAILDALVVRRAILLGNSWGGLTLQAFAEAHPDRIASVIFVGSIPPTSEALQRAGRARGERV